MLYKVQANVYNEKLGPQFGRITKTNVIANNEQDAYKQAEIAFNKYINILYKHHNIDSNGKLRKTINTFNYNNLKLVSNE